MSSSPLLDALVIKNSDVGVDDDKREEDAVLREVNRVLAQGGVDVSAYTDEGESALHLAAQRGFPEVAAALVFGGCDIEVGDWTLSGPKPTPS